MMKGKGVAVLAIMLLLVFALPGLAQTGMVGAILRAGGFLAQWPTEREPGPAAMWARLETQQRAFGGIEASLYMIAPVPISETAPEMIQQLTPWAVPEGAPPEPET